VAREQEETEPVGAVRVDGVELFYREKGDGPAVLLIHGGGVNADHWGECFEQIAQFARAIAYDQRGFSRSVHPPVRGIKRHGDDAAALLRALSAPPAVLLGHSFGGAISLDLAARYSELVRALVLIEPAMDLG
jgi:pimeloyl-ACP methyl ester carboxylesterase